MVMHDIHHSCQKKRTVRVRQFRWSVWTIEFVPYIIGKFSSWLCLEADQFVGGLSVLFPELLSQKVKWSDLQGVFFVSFTTTVSKVTWHDCVRCTKHTLCAGRSCTAWAEHISSQTVKIAECQCFGQMLENLHWSLVKSAGSKRRFGRRQSTREKRLKRGRWAT